MILFNQSPLLMLYQNSVKKSITMLTSISDGDMLSSKLPLTKPKISEVRNLKVTQKDIDLALAINQL